MNRIYHFCLLILFSVFTSNLDAQFRAENLDDTQISILTCRSGDELYSTFGHTAIRVFNPTTRIDYVYNYGLFSFNTPNFYLKFMRGQLPYLVGATRMSRFLREYNDEKRSVFEQVLNLDNNQKEKIIQFLIENVKPENREYKYDFFFDNCATRVVDVYGLAGAVTYDLEVEEKTFRDLLKENLKSLVWEDFGIDLLIGQRADRITNRRDQMFLPEYVMNNLGSAALDGDEVLAQDPHLVLDFEALNQSRKERSTPWPLITMMLILIATIAINMYAPKMAKGFNKIFLIVGGVIGILLLFMWFGTNHGATRDNWNVAWMSPLFLPYLFIKGKGKQYLAYFLMFSLLVCGVNCLIQILHQFFNLAFLPLILSFMLILYWREFKRSGDQV